MTSVVAFVHAPAQRERLRYGVGDAARLTFVTTEDELERTARQMYATGGPIVVITEPHNGRNESVSRTVHRLVLDCPGLTVFAYVSFRSQDLHGFADLMRAGTRGILLQGVSDEPQSLRETLSTAVAQTAPGEALVMLTPLVPRPAMSFVAYVATHAHRPLSVTRAVRDVNAARRTIADALAHARLPSAMRLIGWFRVLHAAPLLSQCSRKVTDVATTLQFPSLAAMDNLFHQYLGRSPKSLRGADGGSIALALFSAEIRARRTADTGANGDSVTSKQAPTRSSLDTDTLASGLLAE
jgi:AraC-like DNA-binding protein